MSQGYIGYIRVSTTKQGEGVSLEVQKDAISNYAQRNHFEIGLWLEEMETAAKQGRAAFTQAMRLLRKRKFKGIILHKLDRGARNLKDWNEIGELSDAGIDVHFVNEGLDLHSRGGRLSADIQAVVAADYIRNLKEETRKGFYGRLKQGFYPLQAPIGYVDNGGAKVKTIDPIKGPLARKAFELYATAHYNFDTLGDELYRLGLRNHRGGRVSRSGLSTLLNNPFYIGIIQIRKTNETFKGLHEPLISKALFDRVQNVLRGKVNSKTQKHAFIYRRMFSCASCNYSLVGERQKGKVYYRCHTKTCPTTSVGEEIFDARFSGLLGLCQFDAEEKTYFRSRLVELQKDWISCQQNEARSTRLRLDQLKDRMNRLTDAFLDQTIDKAAFETRKNDLIAEQADMEEQLAQIQRNEGRGFERIEKFLEQVGTASLSHQLALPEEKREMVKIFTSNRTVNEKNVTVEPSIPFQEIANRFKKKTCGPERAIPRTWDRILAILAKLNAADQLPDLSDMFRQNQNTKEKGKPKTWRFAKTANN